jgi:hypothetical protein
MVALGRPRSSLMIAMLNDRNQFAPHFETAVAGERPDHGEKWFPKLMAVYQLIDREIDPGTVRGALRTPPHGVSRLP